MALFEEVSMAQQASLGLRKRLDPGSPVRLRFDSESRQSRSGSALSILSQCGASLSSSGTLGDAGGAEWVCKPGQVERQFVEQVCLCFSWVVPFRSFFPFSSPQYQCQLQVKCEHQGWGGCK